MVEFVKATSNVNWDAYKESKLREGGQNDKEWKSFVNESVEVMKSFRICNEESELKQEYCEEANFEFEYEFDVKLKGGYIAALYGPAKNRELFGLKDEDDIRRIIDCFVEAVGCKGVEISYNKDLSLESEEDIFERYRRSYEDPGFERDLDMDSENFEFY